MSRSNFLSIPRYAWLAAFALFVATASATILKGPYLQDVRTTGITIMWESDQPTRGIVRYGTDTSYGSSVEEKEARRMHEVLIRDLKIETLYHYKVLSGADSTPDRTLQTAVRADSPFRFAYYGDNKNGPHMHRRNALQIASEKPHIVLQCGDLVNRGDVYSQWERLFFRPARPLMDHVPLYPSLGNHERNAKHYFEHFSLPRTESWYSFDYGNAHFTVLDSNSDHLKEGSSQVEWLVEDLRESQATWKFVSFHHPPFTAGGNYYSSYRIPLKNLLHPIFERYGVDVVFNGHDHNYERSRPIISSNGRSPVTYVVNGNGGTPMRYIGHREWTASAKRVFGYTLVMVQDQRVELHGKTVDGEIIDKLVIDKGDSKAYQSYAASALAFESIKDPVETSRLLSQAKDRASKAKDKKDKKLYGEALELASKAYELDATCAECVVAMGIAHGGLGQKELAIEQFLKSIEIKPQFPNAYEELLKIHLGRGEYKPAIELALKLTKIEPDQPGGQKSLAEIYLKQKQPKKAVEALRRALELVPSDKGLHEDLAELYEGLGRKDQAVQHYREAMNWIDAEDTRELQKYIERIESLQPDRTEVPRSKRSSGGAR